MLGRPVLVAILALTTTACGGPSAREQIKVVGSSTVYPFTTAVAERFVNADPSRRAPVIESTGTGAGFNLFCAGVGSQYPDIQNASRRIKKSEFEQCAANGVRDMIEVQVGSDGLAIAESVNGPRMALTRAQLYSALAATINGRPNPHRFWSDVNPALPRIPIKVLGPPTTSGTRDSFNELMMEPGCVAAFPAIEALKKSPDKDAFKNACVRIRDDGAYIDSGENDNLIVQKLAADPNAIGIFGYSFLEANLTRVRGVPIDGIVPTYETVANAKYPGARPLFIYVKKQHMRAVPGMAEFLATYVQSWEPDGPLVRKGMIAAPAPVRAAAARAVADQAVLTAEGLK
jgi:phosphate transport system substrate-binding protein